MIYSKATTILLQYMYKFLPVPQTLLQYIPSDPSPMNRLLLKLQPVFHCSHSFQYYCTDSFPEQIPPIPTQSSIPQLAFHRTDSFQYQSQSSPAQIPSSIKASLPMDRFLQYYSKASLLLHNQAFPCADFLQYQSQFFPAQISSNTRVNLHMHRFLPVPQPALYCTDLSITVLQ
jgi:hypothetical protein